MDTASGSAATCKILSFGLSYDPAEPPERTPRPDGSFDLNVTFQILALFDGSGSNECGSCEYRQYVRGYSRRKPPGSPWGGDDVRQVYGGTLSRTMWLEDGPAPYGYRVPPPGVTVAPDNYLPPPRTTGCNYNNTGDTPGMRRIPMGWDYEMNVQFYGKIINKEGETVQTLAPWLVKFSGRG